MTDIFDVVADPTRRDLLQVLLDRALAEDSGAGELSVGEMVEILRLSQPTISKHLKVLRDIGLVSVREEGQHRFYSLDIAPLEALEDWLIPFMTIDYETVDGDVGMTVLSAWAGENLRAPFRKVGAALHDPSDVGTAIGRTFAEGARAVRRASADLREAVAGAVRSMKPGSRKVLDRQD